MIVSINQPAYLPWLGYFDRIRKSDLHIVLDHVQFEKGSYTNRTRIQQRDGRVMWLTIPVEKGKPINETKIVGPWRRKHQKALEQAYGWPVRFWDTDSLMEVLDITTAVLSEHLDVKVPWTYSSEWNVPGTKSDLILNLCKEVGATTYLSGPQGRNYLNLRSFDKAGIEVRYHDYPAEQPVLSAVHHLFGGSPHVAGALRTGEGVSPSSRR